MEYAQHLLDECGLGAERLAMYEIAASDAPKWVAVVNEMTEKVKALGPSPLNPYWQPETVVPEEQELAVQTMIIAERKPFAEIKAAVAPFEKVLIAGCGTCVAVCLVGGEKEVGLLASQLKLAGGQEGKHPDYRRDDGGTPVRPGIYADPERHRSRL